MNVLANLFLVAGFCLGTLGAAGFGKVVEQHAWAYFLGGLALVAGGGFLARSDRRGGGDASVVHGERERYRRLLVAIRDEVVALEAALGSLRPADVRGRLDALSRGDLFDLTSAHEDLTALLGFEAYASVWEGVAGGERLLNRAWSMLTDGAVEEGLEEIPLARAQFDAAVLAFERL